MKVTALVLGANLTELYRPGDAVLLEDGSQGVITEIDEGTNLIDIEVPDNADIEKVSVNAPQDIETPFKRLD